jgi:hypothetical protein
MPLFLYDGTVMDLHYTTQWWTLTLEVLNIPDIGLISYQIASGKRINEWGIVVGMKTGRGHGSSQRNSAPVLLRKSHMA